MDPTIAFSPWKERRLHKEGLRWVVPRWVHVHKAYMRPPPGEWLVSTGYVAYVYCIQASIEQTAHLRILSGLALTRTHARGRKAATRRIKHKNRAINTKHQSPSPFRPFTPNRLYFQGLPEKQTGQIVHKNKINPFGRFLKVT